MFKKENEIIISNWLKLSNQMLNMVHFYIEQAEKNKKYLSDDSIPVTGKKILGMVSNKIITEDDFSKINNFIENRTSPTYIIFFISLELFFKAIYILFFDDIPSKTHDIKELYNLVIEKDKDNSNQKNFINNIKNKISNIFKNLMEENDKDTSKFYNMFSLWNELLKYGQIKNKMALDRLQGLQYDNDEIIDIIFPEIKKITESLKKLTVRICRECFPHHML